MTAHQGRVIHESSKSSSNFFFLRDKIEKEIARSILCLGEKNKLRDACEYALTTGGKRLRPIVVYLVAEALGHGLDVSDSALSVELFHTASLIVDDLPCMDNDDERRSKPSLHKVFGEPVALLASYALITAAFEGIQKNTLKMRRTGMPFSVSADRACTLGLESAARCAGILGATGGQFLDLYPPQMSLETLKKIIHQKTVTLFEVSFSLGWIFGGGDLNRLDEVAKAAHHMGMAFQIADDIGDAHQDEKKPSPVNLAHFLGRDRALSLFEEEMRLLREQLECLHLLTPSFEKMCAIINENVAVYQLVASS
jgi:geranylgeranyl diphosphate synthase type II